MFDPEQERAERGFGLEQTIYFSDAVFAVAITLLAIDIQVPGVPADAAAALPRRLLCLVPQFSNFAISFLVIGSYWLAHHRLFGYITAGNQGVARAEPLLSLVYLTDFETYLTRNGWERNPDH